MPEPKSHADKRNWLEELGRKIPGFRGYLEKEYRRDSDALQRQLLADRLQRAKPALDNYGRRLLDQGLITELPALERIKGRMDKLIGQLRGAMQGYSGMFDLVKVDEKVLDRVYEHDVKLLDQVEALAVAIEALPQATGRPAEVLPSVLSSLDSLDQAVHQRTDILKGIE